MAVIVDLGEELNESLDELYSLIVEDDATERTKRVLRFHENL